MSRRLSEFKVDQIMAVYSGRDGACCCGCSGNYYYHPNHTEEGFKHRGYKVTEEEVDIRKVSRIFNLMKKVDAQEIDRSGVFHYIKGKKLYMCILPPSLKLK